MSTGSCTLAAYNLREMHTAGRHEGPRPAGHTSRRAGPVATPSQELAMLKKKALLSP